MKTHRFYTSDGLDHEHIYELPKQVAHHCAQVLRYQQGNQLVLFNGDGKDYLAEIVALQGKKVSVKILNSVKLENESPLRIHLFQSLAKGDKMELVIQKSVELGVSAITPIISDRSNVKFDNDREAKKLVHWQAVAHSACEQCGRAFIPTINPVSRLKELALSDTAQNLFLDPYASHGLSAIPETQTINLFIGPEGGFSALDLSELVRLGASGVTLGPRVLRTETAGFAAIAVLQARFGDL